MNAPAVLRILGRLLRLLTVAAVASVLIAATAFRMSGGRWMTVTTPSMGQTAPVGTLLLVRAEPHPSVGEFVVFHPPGRPHDNYAHRLVARGPAGFSTRGDANGATDPWTLPAGAVQGRVVGRLWLMGWLLRTVPYLLIGAMLTYAVGRFFSGRKRFAVRLALGSLTVAATIMLVRPFVRLVVLVNVAVDGQSATTVVPTGMTGVTVHSVNGSSMHLRPGQIGTLHSSKTASDGQFHISFVPYLTFWWWVATVVGWLAPLIIAVFVSLRQQAGTTAGDGVEGAQATDTLGPAGATEPDEPEPAYAGDVGAIFGPDWSPPQLHAADRGRHRSG